MKPIIQVKNLRKVYRIGNEQVVALDNINLDVGTGEICCIIGTSGSGKSTLLNQLAGLEKPTRGGVLITGKNISRFSENQLAKFRQKNIGFVFQSYNLMASMTALENVSLPLIFRGVSKNKRNKAAKRILKEVGLANRAGHKPSQMSGGQQQRVGIARAFVARPKIIFADEPTGNLDTRTTIDVMQTMVRLCKEHSQTLILVTHDTEIAQYADRIVTIRDGNIISDVINPSPIAGLTEEEADQMAREAAAKEFSPESLAAPVPEEPPDETRSFGTPDTGNKDPSLGSFSPSGQETEGNDGSIIISTTSDKTEEAGGQSPYHLFPEKPEQDALEPHEHEGESNE